MKYIFILLTLFALPAASQEPVIGLISRDSNATKGYILFSPNGYTSTYLIDKCGYLVKEWTDNYNPANSVYLDNNGNLIRPGNLNNAAFSIGGGAGGIIEKKSWDNQLLWTYTISTNLRCQHHDIYPMPNGNILAIIWQKKNKAAAINAGRDTTKIGQFLWDEQIVEIKPIGTDSAEIVWQWHLWDHLIQEFDPSKNNFGIIADHPERININYFSNTPLVGDWVHLNSVAYNPQKDQIILSSRIFSEIWIIDHSTTTAEATTGQGGNSGKGGDILFRWGNPQSYHQGNASDQKFFGQHSACWIANQYPDSGKIMVFNNGKDRPDGDYSSVEIIKPVIDVNNNYIIDINGRFLPDTAEWIYTASPETDLYSSNISSAQRVENGNTIICDGDNGRFYEIDPLGNTVWKYINPVNSSGPQTQGTNISMNTVFRIKQYPVDYPGFSGRTLLPWMPLELSPYPYNCTMIPTGIHDILSDKTLDPYPNPTDGIINIRQSDNRKINVLNLNGQILATFNCPCEQIDLRFLESGIYFINDFSGIINKIVISH